MTSSNPDVTPADLSVLEFYNEPCGAVTTIKLGEHAEANLRCALRQGQHLYDHRTTDTVDGSAGDSVFVTYIWGGEFKKETPAQVKAREELAGEDQPVAEGGEF